MKPNARYELTLRVLGHVYREPLLKTSEIAEALDEPTDKIHTTLRRMRAAGLVRSVSSGNARPWRWLLTQNGRSYRVALLVALGTDDVPNRAVSA